MMVFEKVVEFYRKIVLGVRKLSVLSMRGLAFERAIFRLAHSMLTE